MKTLISFSVFEFKRLVVLFFVMVLSLVSYSQNSLNLEGSGQKWVNIKDIDISGNQITVEALISRQNNMNIVSKHDGTTDCNYLLRPNSFQITTTNGFYICLNPYALTQNTWYHIAATYDGASIKYYVNGCLVNEIPATGDLVVNNWDAAIGTKSNWPTGPEQYRGKIDEVRIWQTARAEVEIALNMNLLLNPTTEPDLRAYYQFDGNYDNIQGYNGFNGNPIGSPAFGAPPPFFTPFAVVSVLPTDVTCYGFSDGEINIMAVGSSLEYSLDGISFNVTAGFTNLGPGSYTVYVRNGPCLESTTVELIEPAEIPAPTLNYNVPVCSTDTLFLSTNQVTSASYFWDGPNGFTSAGFSTNIPNLSSANTGDYSIYLEVDGCYSDTTVATVIVNESYDIQFNETICSNETIVFGPDELNESGVYIQNLQSVAGCDSIVQLDLTVNPSYSFIIDTAICDGESIVYEGLTMTTSGTYPFNLFTTLGCDSIITYELIVHPIPSAPVLLSNSPLECPGDIYELSLAPVADGFYAWTGPNDFTSTAETIEFSAQVEHMGLYTAMVTVNGCESPISESTMEIINIYSFNDFDFPNVVTPNADGDNDVFDLEAYFKTCKAYEMMLFDRWGIMVYTHKENEEPFSGFSMDGSELMQGVYTYKLIFDEGVKQGFIHLIR